MRPTGFEPVYPSQGSVLETDAFDRLATDALFVEDDVFFEPARTCVFEDDPVVVFVAEEWFAAVPAFVWDVVFVHTDPAGFEPTAVGLKDHCSCQTELRVLDGYGRI